MTDKALSEALDYISKETNKYKKIKESYRHFQLLQETFKENLISCRQRLEEIQDSYSDYLPIKVSFEINETITDLQLLDSQLVEMYAYIDKHLKD